jgi:hypothetical protein
LTVAAGIVSNLGASAPFAAADEPKGSTKPAEKPSTKKTATKPAPAPSPTPEKPTYLVYVDLRIAGLTRKGCDVEIKPASLGSKFKPVTQHIDSDGTATLEFKDIESESADRDCTFAITIREPGHAEKTVKRGLRLKSPGKPGQTLECFLSSPSKIARTEKESAIKR